MRERIRKLAGPAVRRSRRELQWWRHRSAMRLERVPELVCPNPVFSHATPLFRGLSGVDHELELGKVANLRLAVGALDGRMLQPGQRLSFWWFVRAPTARRGFRPGLVLDEGRLLAGVGGGLCQLTNLLYWMTVHTPLTVVERWRHTYDVFPDTNRTQPFASGATCAYPSLDLQIVNETTSRYRLGLVVDGTHLRGAWTADHPPVQRYEVYESAHQITHDLPGVYVRRNELRRRVFDLTGQEVADEFVTANAALMRYHPVLEGPPDRGPA